MMKVFGCALLLLSAGCGKLNTYNSNAKDEEIYGRGGPQIMTQAFVDARSILQEKCASCHVHNHSAFASYSEKDWADSGYVKGGDARNSRLFQRLRGAGLGLAAENMPPEGALSSVEIAAIKTWITQMARSGALVNPGPTAPPPARTEAALAVLKVNGCLGCHAQEAPLFSEFTADKDFIDAGLVLAGYVQVSPLYRSLRKYGDRGRMPLFGAALTDNDEEILRDWIQNMPAR